MRRTIATLLLFAGFAAAQNTAVFPTATASTSDLPVASNNYSSTLSSGVNSTATTIAVPSTSGFTAPGLISINSEVIAVCAVASGTALTVGHSACPNADGRGYDNTSAVSHLANQVVAGRITARHINQLAAEVTALEGFARGGGGGWTTTMFGAKCDGTDDTAAIQSAFNYLGNVGANRTLTFPCTSTVSNVYVPGTASGIILRGSSSPISYNDTTGLGDALIAKTGSTGALLTIYAPEPHLENLAVNCNSQNYVGIVFAGTIDGRGSVFQSKGCAGPGGIVTPVVGSYAAGTYGTTITPAAGTSTSLTSQLNSGSTSGATFTVTSTALQGVNLGAAPQCSSVLIGWGTSTQEAVAISHVSTNTLTISTTTSYTHASGSSAQCDFTNSGMVFNRRAAFGNAGWGLEFIKQDNGNTITDNDFMDFANAMGGVLASGTGLRFTAGHSEGNNGPAIQLGDLNGGGSNGTNGRVVLGSFVDPFGDIENNGSGNNAVADICGEFNQIHFNNQTTFTPATSASVCPFAFNGVDADLGYGYGQNADSGKAQFVVKNLDGTVRIQPNDPTGDGGNVFAGIMFYNAAGTFLNSLTGNSSTTGALSAGKASTSYSTPQWEVNGGKFNDGTKLDMGVRTDTGASFLQALTGGSTPATLTLNPLGGSVALGGPITNLSRTGTGTEAVCSNKVVADAALSANNALVGTLSNAITGVAITPVEGTELCVKLNGFTLQAGANTLKLNGTTYNIGSIYSGVSIGHAYTDTGTWARFIFVNGRLADESQ